MLTWFMLVINLAKHFRLLEMSFFTKPLVFPVVLGFKINVVHFFTLKCAKPKHKLSNSSVAIGLGCFMYTKPLENIIILTTF